MYEYDYGYGYDTTYTTASTAGLGIYLLIYLAFIILVLVSTWKLYKKAGRKGWESIVPIYSNIVLIQIAELPLWYIALFFIPFANIYAIFKIYIEVAHKFGKSTGFGVLMTLFSPICIPILAFGKAEYKGGSSAVQTMNMTQPLTPQPTNEPIQMGQPLPQAQPITNANPMNFQTDMNTPVAPVIEPVIEPVNQGVQSNVNNSGLEDKKYCPSCGNQLSKTANFCNMCGHNFQG